MMGVRERGEGECGKKGGGREGVNRRREWKKEEMGQSSRTD